MSLAARVVLATYIACVVREPCVQANAQSSLNLALSGKPPAVKAAARVPCHERQLLKCIRMCLPSDATHPPGSSSPECRPRVLTFTHADPEAPFPKCRRDSQCLRGDPSRSSPLLSILAMCRVIGRVRAQVTLALWTPYLCHTLLRNVLIPMWLQDLQSMP